jgi:hypothetical protein
MRVGRTDVLLLRLALSILTTEGLCGAEVVGGDPDETSGTTMAFAVGDIKAAFHHMRINDELGRWFTFPYRLTAAELGLAGHVVGGRRLRAQDLVWLRAGSLPMGFPGSLFFCQSVGETSVARSVPQAELVKDRGPLEFPAKRRALVGVDVVEWVRFYIYVDNLGAFAGIEEEARAALDAVIADLSAFGLIIHETEVSTFEVEALGTHVDLVQLCAGVTASRRTRVHGALRAGCRRLTMNGRMVEILVGHATFCGLAQRAVLATFDAV